MGEQPQPWLASDSRATEGKRHAPATVRNREVIGDALATQLPPSGTVLEIASGSGEHAVYFAGRFPQLRWIPSDPDPAALASITAWAQEANLPNIAPPRRIDAEAPAQWDVGPVDALVCINMVHISPWAASVGLFAGAARLLPAGAPLILYGPYLEAEVETAPSNLAFDQSLKARNPLWGLRDVAQMDAVATKAGFARACRVAMPANNLLLVYRKS